MRCGDYGRLIAWVCGEVSEAERARVEAHLEECAACRREAGELETLIHLMQTDESVQAPPEVRAAVLRLFEASRGGDGFRDTAVDRLFGSRHLGEAGGGGSARSRGGGAPDALSRRRL